MTTQWEPSRPSQASEDLDNRGTRLPRNSRAALDHRAEDIDRARPATDLPAAGRLLTELTGDAQAARALTTMLTNTLETALSSTRGERGTIQLVDRASGALAIVVQVGFEQEFLDQFAVVDGDDAAGGRAVRQRTQIVIEDVNRDLGFAAHRGAAASAGFRAVVSTPLIAATGRALGAMSIHYRRPHRPPAERLKSMALTAELISAALVSFLDGGQDTSFEDPIAGAEATYAADARAWLSSLGSESADVHRLTDDANVGPLLADLLAAYLVAMDELAELRPRIDQLQQALVSRIAIEQAKGIIAATGDIGIDEAFEALRGYARRHNTSIHDTANAVIHRGLRF